MKRRLAERLHKIMMYHHEQEQEQQQRQRLHEQEEQDQRERDQRERDRNSPSLSSLNQFFNSILTAGGGSSSSSISGGGGGRSSDDSDSRTRGVDEVVEQHAPRYTSGPNAQIGPTYIIRSTGTGTYVPQISNAHSGTQFIVQRSSSSTNANGSGSSRIEELD